MENIYNNIPQYVKEHGLFCCWKYEDRKGKQSKVPYNVLTGKHASSDKRETFTDFEKACSAAAEGNYDGIGLGIFGDICAIDIDDCVTDGVLTELANSVVAMMQSYTELSPSGEGVRILFQAKDFPYDENYYTMNHKRGLEVYVAGATNKYVTVTGNRIDTFPEPFCDRSQNLQTVLNLYMKKDESKNAGVNVVNAVNSVNVKNNIGADTLLRLAFNSKKGKDIRSLYEGDCSGYSSQSEADGALCMHLAFWTDKDMAKMDKLFRQSVLMRDKWDEKHGSDTYGVITMKNAIDECKNTFTNYQGDFLPLIDLKERIPKLPPFPVEALPPILANQVRAVAEHSQTTEGMAGTIALGVLAVCLQGKYRVEGSPGYYEPLSLYTVIIAAPGERKSSVMREMTSCLYEYEKTYNERRKSEIQANKQQRSALQREIQFLEEKLKVNKDESMEVRLRNLEIELDELPVLKVNRFTADDCSSEALISLLAENNGIMAVLSTEGGSFETMAGRYSSGNANLDVWLKGHCGDTIMVDRKGRESEAILNPHLSAILMIQPSVLEEIMGDKKMNGRGLIARFLFSSPPSLVGQRHYGGPRVPEATDREYKELIFRLMDIPVPEQSQDLQLSEDATRKMEVYFAEHEQYLVGEGQTIIEWASKYIGAVLRIAGLLHVATENKSNIITAETIEKAISIGKYLLEHAQYAYELMGADDSMELAKHLLQKIKRNEKTAFKVWQFERLCTGKKFNVKGFDDMISAVELLESCGVLRLQKAAERSGSGRKSDDMIVINPKIWEPAVRKK